MADFSGDIPAVDTAQTANTNGYVDFTKMAEENFHTPESIEADAALLGQGVHDEGNAACVNLRHNHGFLFNASLGWLYHTGTHWERDEDGLMVERAVTETLQARIMAALNAGGDTYANIIRKCIPNSGKVQGTKNQLRSMVKADPEHFDRDPDLLNCKNGLVDLRTGEIHLHSTSQRLMHCTRVDYRPGADRSVWVNWLNDAVGKTVADWLQMAVGYSITGHTREEILFYLFGPPRSGKGTFTEALIELLGRPLAREVDFSTFVAQRTGDSQNFDLAPLKPCRFIAASESNAYERFNEAKIKKLTGGNDIYCAFKHHNHFNYKPQFKIWLSSNQPVNADPDDEAVWGRLRVVEFPHSHLGQEDKSLKEIMRSSDDILEGILAWAVSGAQQWYKLGKTGLPELECSAKVKTEQRSELDNVQAWLDEQCKKADGKFSASAELYQSYESWCKSNGVEPKKQKGFSQALKHKGFADGRDTISGKLTRGFKGIHLS